MSNPILLIEVDSNVKDMQSGMNDQLSDIYAESYFALSYDYGNSKNRVMVSYNPGDSTRGSANFEIIAYVQSTLTDLTNDLTSEIAKQQATASQLLPTIMSGDYANDKHRAVIGMVPASVSDLNPKGIYSVSGYKNSNANDLVTSVNSFVSGLGSGGSEVIDIVYYYGNSNNFALVLWVSPA